MGLNKDGWINAILLVAGKGKRLKPFTNSMPKPLTEVNGVPIVKNALQHLADFGVKNVYLVTGYLHEQLMEFCRLNSFGLNLHEIYNPDYADTNNMYSLWLAKEILSQGTLLIEGDVFFERNVLQALKTRPPTKNYWLADEFASFGEGCMLKTDDANTVTQLQIVRNRLEDQGKNCYKSAGILAITPGTGDQIGRWLEEDIRRGRVDVYYDLILADHLAEAQFEIINIHGKKWFEIDDLDDLKKAEALFAQHR